MSSLRRSWAIARTDLAVLSRDATVPILLVFMPLLMMTFLKPTFRAVLRSEGFDQASGAEHAIPGMSVFFAFFLLGFVGVSFFHEHDWCTWDRLRASEASSLEIVVGKAIPALLVAAGQQTVLFVLGWALFDLEVRGSIVALALVAASLSVCLVAIGVALVAYSHSISQLTALANVGGVVAAGLGGALTPVSLIPSWAQAVARFTPTYWAMEGFKEPILEGGGVASVSGSVLVLLAVAAAATTLAATRFRVGERKVVT